MCRCAHYLCGHAACDGRKVCEPRTDLAAGVGRVCERCMLNDPDLARIARITISDLSSCHSSIVAIQLEE